MFPHPKGFAQKAIVIFWSLDMTDQIERDHKGKQMLIVAFFRLTHNSLMEERQRKNTNNEFDDLPNMATSMMLGKIWGKM